MSIYRTNNPLEYAEVDGIVIDEQAPSPDVKGIGTGTVILVGQFQRGPATLERMSGIQAIHELYGKSNFSGNIQLKNKKFSVLKIARVIAADAVLATLSVDNDTVPGIKFDAKSKGAYGNLLKITIEAGSVAGKKYTFADLNPKNAEFFPPEIYDNVLIANVDLDTFAASKIIDVTVLSVLTEPGNTAITALATGSDGTIVDTDYETEMKVAEAPRSGDVLFLDVINQVRNTYLKTHAGLTRDKIVICSEEEADSTTDNETDVALLRDTEGRIIYAVNWIQTVIDGVPVYTNPASWIASIISQIGPHIDPAFVENTQFLFGVTGLKKVLNRDDYKRLMAAGCCAFEDDIDIGFKIKSGIVTQILNSSKLTILRRRMADYLTNSIGRFLKNYQNAPNRLEERTASKAAILTFIQSQETEGILPTDAEVLNGLAKIVDIDSENTNDSIAAGKFIIIYKQRIFNSMRFIILKAEIGESVVVVEGE